MAQATSAATVSAAPDGWAQASEESGGWRLVAGGDWVLETAAKIDRQLRGLALPSRDGQSRPGGGQGASATIDLGRLGTLDTAGAWLIRRTIDELEGRGVAVVLHDASPVHDALLREVGRAERGVAVAPPQVNKLLEITDRTGRTTIRFAIEAVSLIGFFGMVLVKLAGVIARPRRLRFTALTYHIEQTGLNAMPIVGLLSFLIGVVLTYQGADQLRRFGAEVFAVNLLGISVLRELGILITAIMVAGRSGSAFTAQIGTMKVSEEVDALQTIGLDPVEVLVLPRILALAISLPALTFFADVIGLLGGAVMCYFLLDISFEQFVRQLQSAVSVSHFWAGMVKAPVFAFTIAMVGCYEGLKVSGSAESVGRLTTKSVVESIFLVILLDALFSILFSALGV